MVATMTGGERGDILNEEIRNAPRAHRDLPGLRRTEMARAAEILGIEHRWIGFMDSGLPEGDPLSPTFFRQLRYTASRTGRRTVGKTRTRVQASYYSQL